jgi:hypothetical protein
MKKTTLVFLFILLMLILLGCEREKIGDAIEINMDNYQDYLALNINYDIIYSDPYFNEYAYEWQQSKHIQISFSIGSFAKEKRKEGGYESRYLDESLSIEIQIDRTDIDEYWDYSYIDSLLSNDNKITVTQRVPNNFKDNFWGIINTRISEDYKISNSETIKSTGSSNRYSWKEVNYTVIKISGTLTRIS